MDLMDYLNQAKSSLFRYEGLQSYQGDNFDEIESYMKEWWDFIHIKTHAGIKMQRVRLIIEPMSSYVKQELKVHKMSTLYGDDIRIIRESSESLQDFWLVDEKNVLLINYSVEGLYLGFQVSEDVEKYIQIKRNLLERSTPLTAE